MERVIELYRDYKTSTNGPQLCDVLNDFSKELFHAFLVYQQAAAYKRAYNEKVIKATPISFTYCYMYSDVDGVHFKAIENHQPYDLLVKKWDSEKHEYIDLI